MSSIPEHLASLFAAGADPASDPAADAGFAGFIERRPQAAFAAFLTLHFAIWTTLPTLLYANLPLDVIEALTFGREWPLGSYKLPPLPWWLVEIMYKLFGTDAAYYALAEIVVILAFVAIWATARPLVGATGALIAVLIIDGMHFYQYRAVKFNHDVIQLPFWALAGYCFHAALKRGHLGHWLLLGVAFGGALWAKYFVVMLAAPYALFLLFDRDARRALRGPGPWLAVALALIITSPHLVWLIKNHFLPFNYVEERSAPVRGWFDHILHPASFALVQLFFLLPALLIAAMYVRPRGAMPLIALVEGRWRRKSEGSQRGSPNGTLPTAPASDHAAPGQGDRAYNVDAFDRRIITVLAFGPAATMLALTAASGRGTHPSWGYPLWNFIGLWIVLFAPRALDAVRWRGIIAAWAAVTTILIIAFTADYTILPRLDHRYRAAFFPGSALAATLTQRFHEATGGRKLRYVIGSMWVAGNVAHYSPDQPSVLIDGLPRRSPWINLEDLRAKGAILAWNSGNLDKLPARYAAVAPGAKVGAPFTLPPRRFGTKPQHFGWAILMPRSRPTSH